MTPVIGAPLAGFGGKERRLIPWDVFDQFPYVTFFKPSEGVLDPIRAKAMIVRRGDQKLLFLSLDVVGAAGEFREALLEKIGILGFTREEVFLSATHTHNGPGALTRNWLWAIIATDVFNRDVHEAFMDGVFMTVLDAYSTLEPSEVLSVAFPVEGLQKNRRGHAGHFDPTANALLARGTDGGWRGGIVNLAVHGTAAGLKTLQFSSDLPGAIERALEAGLRGLNGNSRAVTTLFVNGAEGDVSPGRQGASQMSGLGALFAEQAIAALRLAAPVSGAWEVSTANVPLGKARFNLRACVKGMPKIRVGVGKALPREAPIALIRWGGIAMMTWPGEPTTSLGLALKAAAAEAGATRPWVLGLTNEHLAYFTTEEEYREGGYEACSSLYGGRGGRAIVEAHRALLGLR